METPHWTELGREDLIQNRQEYLVELEAELETATHPIDVENLQMRIHSTKAVIICEQGIIKLLSEGS